MTARIIDGKKIASQIREELAREVQELVKARVTPGLAVLLVGDDPASEAYVKSIKRKAAESIGCASRVQQLPASASESTVLREIERLNENPEVHGLLVQIPLPEHLDPLVVQKAIDPRKDVDGLHPENAGLLSLGQPRFIPCTPLGVKVLMTRSGIKVEGADVVVVGRSNLVGRPLSILLSQKKEGANATVTLCHTGTVNLEAHTRNADILIVAAGTPKGITGDMVKPGVTVIDVGINRTNEGMVGDVDFESVAEVAQAITPVPGGVGPMTVAMLLSNTISAARLTL